MAKVRQLVADEATVLVWNNAKGTEALDHPGHAAMMLRMDQLPSIAEKAASSEKYLEAAAVKVTRKIEDLRDRYEGPLDEIAQAEAELRNCYSPNARNIAQRQLNDVRRMHEHVLNDLAALEAEHARVYAELGQRLEPDYLLWSYLDPTELEQYEYVSWWPGVSGRWGVENDKGGANLARRGYVARGYYEEDMYFETSGRAQENLRDRVFQPRPNQVQIDMSRSRQGQKWGTEPDVVISVPAMGKANRYLGVSGFHAWTWFQARKRDREAYYKYVSTKSNCSGVVVQALKAGGAEAFVNIPFVGFAMTPRDAAQWASQVRVAICNVNAGAMRLETNKYPNWKLQQMTLRGRNWVAPQVGTELWTVSQWKTASHEKGQHRGSSSSTVEQSLATYHTLQWTSDFARKFKHLVRILQTCINSVDNHGAGHRNGAFATLGMQCLAVQRSPDVRGVTVSG